MLILHLQCIRANFRNVQLFSLKKTKGLQKNPIEDNTWSSAPKAEHFAFLPEKQRSPGWKGKLSARPFNQTVILEQGRRPKKIAASQHGKQTQGGPPGESSSGTAGSQQDLLPDTSSSLLASRGPPGLGGDSTSHS